MNYADTSALIKRFVAEKGTPLVHIIVSQRGPIATAKIAYAEVYAALARQHRGGHLSRGQYILACRQFEREWEAYIRVALSDEVLWLSRDLIQRHPLRGFDAIHLASALTLSNALEEKITFIAADNRLLHAAEVEGLEALNVERASHLP